jgi:hypothetical protein
MTAVLGEI